MSSCSSHLVGRLPARPLGLPFQHPQLMAQSQDFSTDGVLCDGTRVVGGTSVLMDRSNR